MSHIVQKCITSGCNCYSNEYQGRHICIEPDDDGWICERCWLNISQPVQPVVRLAVSISVSIGQPVITHQPVQPVQQQSPKSIGRVDDELVRYEGHWYP